MVVGLQLTWRSAVLLVARYGGEHSAPELQKEAVYGLTEIYRDQIKPARLVANPGCYPTTVQLPLYPLLKSKLILPEDIIIDSKSGACSARRVCATVKASMDREHEQVRTVAESAVGCDSTPATTTQC